MPHIQDGDSAVAVVADRGFVPDTGIPSFRPEGPRTLALARPPILSIRLARVDAPASAAQKKILSGLSPSSVKSSELAGDPITAMLTNAPGDGKAIGGLKVVTDKGWFAARPSGTEEVYKLYAESFVSDEHLKRIQAEAQQLLSATFQNA